MRYPFAPSYANGVGGGGSDFQVIAFVENCISLRGHNNGRFCMCPIK